MSDDRAALFVEYRERDGLSMPEAYAKSQGRAVKPSDKVHAWTHWSKPEVQVALRIYKEQLQRDTGVARVPATIDACATVETPGGRPKVARWMRDEMLDLLQLIADTVWPVNPQAAIAAIDRWARYTGCDLPEKRIEQTALSVEVPRNWLEHQPNYDHTRRLTT